MTAPTPALPPGQRPRADQPPFGLPWYAHRMPRVRASASIDVQGPGVVPFLVTGADLLALPRVEQTSDLHCVTSWSRQGARWAGVRFAAFYEELVAPRLADPGAVARVRVIGADGYGDALPLADLLAGDVLLADELDGEPLSRGHGAPLRLVAPAHYAYKSVKYVEGIELLGPGRRLGFSLHHPRARVVREERFHGLPGALVRVVYRRLIRANAWWFRRTMRR